MPQFIDQTSPGTGTLITAATMNVLVIEQSRLISGTLPSTGAGLVVTFPALTITFNTALPATQLVTTGGTASASATPGATTYFYTDSGGTVTSGATPTSAGKVTLLSTVTNGGGTGITSFTNIIPIQPLAQTQSSADLTEALRSTAVTNADSLVDNLSRLRQVAKVLIGSADFAGAVANAKRAILSDGAGSASGGTLAGNWTIGGTADITGTLNMHGQAVTSIFSLSQNTGKWSFDSAGAGTLATTLSVTGIATLGGLVLNGTASINNQTMTGVQSINHQTNKFIFDNTGNGTLAGTLGVTGVGTFGGLVLTGSIAMGNQAINNCNKLTVVANGLDITGDALLKNHLLASGTAPFVATGIALGSGGSIAASVAGNDIAGVISLTYGNSPPAGSGKLCTLTYHTAYVGTIPIVMLTPTDDNVAIVGNDWFVANRTLSGFEVWANGPSAATNGFAAAFAYHVIG